jgi:hypothetical protein
VLLFAGFPLINTRTGKGREGWPEARLTLLLEKKTKKVVTNFYRQI